MPTLITTETQHLEFQWEKIGEMARQNLLNVGDQIELIFDGKPTLHDIIGINADRPAEEQAAPHTFVTIQMHDLLEERPFDTKGVYGSNVWETSELREYLNNGEFLFRYDDLADHIVPVIKENSEGSTVDRFFLLSVDELDPEKTPYAYYKDIRNRVKFEPAGYADWHWTRSPYRSGAYGAWSVTTSGSVTSNHASTAYRVSPACVLIF